MAGADGDYYRAPLSTIRNSDKIIVLKGGVVAGWKERTTN